MGVLWSIGMNGKRHDKSFGRGDGARLRAEAYDFAIQQAKAEGIAPVQVAPVIETAAGPVLDAHNAAPAIEPVVQVAVAPVEAVEANVAPVAQIMPSPVAGITFGQLSMMYLDHLRVSGRTEKHIASLENLLKRMFFDILGRDTPVAGMTYLKDIVPFIRQMQGVSQQTGKPRSQASVNRYCDYVDAIFNFGMEMELISKSPMKGEEKGQGAASGCPDWD